MPGRSVRIGLALAVLALSSTDGLAATTPAPAAPAPGPCDSPAHHQLDFWVGRWDVYSATGDQLVAHSLIEKLYGGCTVRENWMPLANAGGGSLNSYRPKDGSWHQYWVDSHNNVNEYVGRSTPDGIRWDGEATDRSGAVHKVRMTYTRVGDASVRQTCQTSADGGATWQVDCDLIYKRSPAGGAVSADR